MANKQLGIFYIDANKAYFYGSNSTSILQVAIPTDTMAYGDIVNKDKFYQIIQALVTTNKIQPVPLLILFSPYGTYEKDAVGKIPDEINTEIQQFLDAVPYERILSRIYKLQDKTKVVAVNKDVYEDIRHAFEKLQFSTVAVVSLALLQQVVSDIGSSLNLETIANKFDSIKQYSFVSLDEINNPGRANQQQADSPKENPLRLYGLIGVFAVLLGVLLLMVVSSMQPARKPVVVAQPPVRVVTPIPTVTIPSPTTPVVKAAVESSASGKVVAPLTPKVTP